MNDYKEYLKYEFTDAEIAGQAKDLASANRKRSSIEQRKKEIDSDLKAKIEEQNSLIGRLSESIATGFEYRDISCRIELDTPDKGRKRIVRLDTGEEVRILVMTDEDLQMSIDLQEEASRAEAEKQEDVIVPPPPIILQIDAPWIEPTEVTNGAPLAPAAVMGGTHQGKGRKKSDEANG